MMSFTCKKIQFSLFSINPDFVVEHAKYVLMFSDEIQFPFSFIHVDLHDARQTLANYMFSLQPLFWAWNYKVETAEKYILANNTVIECDLNQLQTRVAAPLCKATGALSFSKQIFMTRKLLIKEPKADWNLPFPVASSSKLFVKRTKLKVTLRNGTSTVINFSGFIQIYCRWK